VLLVTSLTDFWLATPLRFLNVTSAMCFDLISSSLGRYFNIIYLSIYLSIHPLRVLLLDLDRFFRFLILYTVGRTPWTGYQPVARPLPTQKNTNRINAHSHPYLEWDSNSRSQRSRGRRRFMPYTVRPLLSAFNIIAAFFRFH
jgi:hypothetical protein